MVIWQVTVLTIYPFSWVSEMTKTAPCDSRVAPQKQNHRLS